MANQMKALEVESLSSLDSKQDENENLVFDLNNTNTEVFDKIPEDLNVLDVYSIASSVGREFDRLTDAFGGVVFVGVMPKIIRTLEILESLVNKVEMDRSNISELSDHVKRLKLDSEQKDEKLKKELEILETAWKEETQDLLQSVAQLEEDNKKLGAALSENVEEENDNEVGYKSNQAKTSILKLQELSRKQREEIKAKDRMIKEQSEDMNALALQIERFSKWDTELRTKISLLEYQGKVLIEEKNELQLKKLNENKTSVAELQMSNLNSPKKQKSTDPATSNQGLDDQVTLDPLLANKLVIDLSDPNRPRYTLDELQEVLNDRNQLKARCFLLEDELLYHRGEESWVEIDGCEVKTIQQIPDRKKIEQSGSGIHRFFSYLTESWYKDVADKNAQKITPSLTLQQHEVVEIDRSELVRKRDIDNLLQTGNNNAEAETCNVSAQDFISSESEISDFSP